MLDMVASGSFKVMRGEVITKNLFKAEVRAWATRIGVEVTALHIRRMPRKWGSCSTAGRLTLNADLMHQSAEVRRQVIVHELLHVKVPNHGRVFRALLRSYLSAGPPIGSSQHSR